MENKDIKDSSTNISELAKWGSIIIAGITIVVLLSDWIYTLNYYRTLGVPELASSKFLTDPLHLSGVLSLWVGLIMVGVYCLGMILLLNLIGKPILKQIPHKFHVPLLIFIAISMYIAMAIGEKNLDTSSFSIEIVSVIPFLSVFPIVALLWFLGDNYIKDIATRNIFFLAIILISANFFFSSFVVKFSATAGKSDAEKILQGEQNLPVIALITKEKIVLSDKISVMPINDGQWVYSPQLSKHPKTGNTIASLQFIGSDDRNIYVLDLWGSSVHSISKDNIAQIIYFNFSDDALISSGINPVFLPTPLP